MKPKSARSIILAAIVFACVLWWFLHWVHFLYSPLIAANKVVVKFELQSGTSAKHLAHKLHAKGLLKDPLSFILLVKLKGHAKDLQAGEYELTPGITAEQLITKIVQGDVILYPFTIVPGWTFNKILVVMKAEPKLNGNLSNLSNAEIMRRLEIKGHPEGKFFPETYMYSKGSSEVAILKDAYELMQNKLNEMWGKRDPKVPYRNSYQALIAASIIEKETSIAEEKPIIAGIIIRRLQKRMFLQLDPTVVYGLKEKYKGNLSKKNLREKTKYNTYRRIGLPPTPICMPSGASIYAALHPNKGKQLYFVARGDGTHVFSDTLEQHNRAVKKYRHNYPT